MTTVVCPICAKHTPTTSFHTEGIPVDIRVLEKRGLGRGKGFETTSDESILDIHLDSELLDVLEQIAARAIETIRLLIDRGKLDPAGVAQDLGLE